MINIASFKGFRLQGGFVILEVEFTSETLVDPLGREAAARTRIVGSAFHLLMRSGLSQRELSITFYHEVLEAALVASLHPPARLVNFNEGDFERVAQAMHEELGEATPEKLNRMLQFYGFGAQ